MAQGIGDTTDNPKTQKNPKKNAAITHGFCPSVLRVLRRFSPASSIAATVFSFSIFVPRAALRFFFLIYLGGFFSFPWSRTRLGEQSWTRS
jgi:hypothetical protein